MDGVTKLDKLDFTNREEQKAESLRKMILAMSKDIRVVIIKLADRLHNHAHPALPARGAAEGHRPRDAGHLRPPGAPVWA